MPRKERHGPTSAT